ncbi:STAS domain-containing protein [Streptomyces sp. NPDC019990]|uniref:STAS domain-containing protein n=1 Tax=Streptomyces sp. NPDC019990 TaxID=3154693 RepID=UPI0033CAC22A
MPEPAYAARSHTRKGAAPAAADDPPTAVPPCMATMAIAPDDYRTTVTLEGDLDLGSRRLLPGLRDALTLSGSGVDLHLDTVGFCDCSGISTLLDLRTHALGQGKTVTIRSSGRAVERLLGLTGTRELFTDVVDADAHTAEGRPGGDGEHDLHSGEHDVHPGIVQPRRAEHARPTAPPTG